VPGVTAAPVPGAGDVEGEVATRIAEFDLRGATNAINAAVAALNQDLEATKPWTLAGSDAVEAVDAVLARQVAGARSIARAARPIVPDLAVKLLGQLTAAPRLPDPVPAFARIVANVPSAAEGAVA
jgi:methionyl-tRNA synthetase